MASLETILLIASILLLLSTLASKISSRLSLPALLVFLVIGMLAGSEGIGGIYFDNAQLAQAIGVVALILILFSGGLDTPLVDVRPVLARGIILSTAGVFITAAVVAVFAALLLNFPPTIAVLLGAIVASTDAAAIFSIFRTRQISLKESIIPLLEFESASNDPTAIFLTVAAIELITHPDASPGHMLLFFIQQTVLGGILGLAAGIIAGKGINRLRLDATGMYPIVTTGVALITYSVTALLGGSGFLAVYLAGLALGAQKLVHKNSLSRFHDSLAWLMQIVMFLVLGLLVFPSRLVPIAIPGLVIAFILIFAARPLGVFIALIRSKFTIRDKLMISWVGLRGAAPIVLAMFPLLAGIPEADTIFNIVFFVVLSSTLLQGTTIVPVANFLKVSTPYTPKPQFVIESVGDAPLKSEMTEIRIPPQSAAINRQIVHLGLPSGSLIVLILRDQEVIVPSGTTAIQANDLLLVLADAPSLEAIRSIVA